MITRPLRRLLRTIAVAIVASAAAAGARGQDSPAPPASSRNAAPATQPAGTAEPALRRWAILALPEVQKSGLADLVLAELSLIDGLELVERDQIALATRELVWSEVSGADAVHTRLELGRTLRADALVILAAQQADGKELVKVVLSDCVHGARLRVEYFADTSGQGELLARSIAATVTETRSRFAGGIRHLIGIPDFVSRNLTHHYDHLQAGYAHLLASVCWATPATAVIETQEAHAIRQEIERTAGADIQRVVPLFIEGEYEVLNAISGHQPRVRLQLRVSDGAKVIESVSCDPLDFPAATEFLKSKLIELLRDVTGNGLAEPVSVEQQFSLLASRAETFARLGAWEHSTGLREACLLLKPGDAGQRSLVIDEYVRLIEGMTRRSLWGTPDVPAADREARCRRRMQEWRRALEHVEFLIRNRLANVEDATELSHVVLRSLSTIRRNFPLTLVDEMKAIEAQRRTFLLDVYPLALALEPKYKGHDSSATFFPEWQRFGFLHALARFYEWNRVHSHERLQRVPDDDLTFIFDVIERLAIPNPETNDDLLCFLYVNSIRDDDQTRMYPEADYLAFLHALRDSKEPVHTFYGRYGLLWYQWWPIQQVGGLPAGVTLDEVKVLAAEARALRNDLAIIADKRRRDPLDEYLGRMIDEMEARVARLEAGSGAATTQTASTTRPAAEKPAETTAVGGTLHFEVVPFELTQRSGQVRPLANEEWRCHHPCIRLLDCLRCGKGFDVLWNGGALLYHDRPGHLREVIVDPDADILAVTWDGENVWVGTGHKDIWVLDRSGTRVATIGSEQGLPPREDGLVLYPVAPGRVCAVGSFGEHHRAWCAKVEFTEGAGRVEVFHQATRVATGATGREKFSELLNDPTGDLAFRPLWMCALGPEPTEPHERLLVGRNRGGVAEGPYDYHPLQIDLRTWAVSVRALTPYEPKPGAVPLWVIVDDRKIWLPHWGNLLLGGPDPGRTLRDGTLIWDLCRATAPGWMDQNKALYHQGRVYLFGARFGTAGFRLDPKTLRVERLVPGPMPTDLTRGRPPFGYGVSAHFGLVTWNEQNIFARITVTEAREDPGDADHPATTVSP